MVLGDDITTDHISPAGWIDAQSAAGQWLVERGGNPKDLNVYASYRGNWEVMYRGLFTNKSAKNLLADDLPIATTPMRDGRILPLLKRPASLTRSGNRPSFWPVNAMAWDQAAIGPRRGLRC